MHWSDDALSLLERIPDEIRPMAKQMMEQYAESQGIETISDEMMKDVRKSFEARYGEQARCPFKDGSAIDIDAGMLE